MKKIIFAIFTVFLILTLSGCVGGIDYNSTKQEIKAKASSSYDPYQKVTNILGPKVFLPQIGENIFFSAMSASWRIRGWKYDSGTETYQIYVSDKVSSEGYRNFRSATNINGKNHKFTYIDSDIDVSCWGGRGAGCNTYYTENFGIELSREDMNAGLKDGIINIKVYSKSGQTRTILVNTEYINAILDVADAN